VFECVITVKGGNNSPSKDGPVTGPVESFFRNYSKCYTAVKNHVLKCPRCCPEEALRRFLAARDRPNLGGFTSPGLLKMVYEMERAVERGKCAPGKTLSKEAVNEYVIRTGAPDNLAKNAQRLSHAELVRALRWVWKRWEFDLDKRLSDGGQRGPCLESTVRASLWRRSSEDVRGQTVLWLVRHLGEAFKAGGPFPDLGDLEDLATVASVMCG
jgi:hypothetical protein